jgi:hypothetical protein
VVCGSSRGGVGARRHPGLGGGTPFRTGWWESTEVNDSDGQATSFKVERTRRARYQLRHLLASGNDCGSGDFVGRDPRIPVDRRGRFRYRVRDQSTGITAVRGRLTGWRRNGAALRLWWDQRFAFPASCLLTYRFIMRPVMRVPVRTGRWAGTDTAGRPVEFFVREQGRYIYWLRAPGPYPLRCTDGSVTSAEAYVEAAWIGADGNVELPASPGDAPRAGVTLDARIGGVSAAGGFRLLGLRGETPAPYGSSCDSEPTYFQAAWTGRR